MWIQVFIETQPDIPGKLRRKRVSRREKKPDFAKLRLVQNAWELRSQEKRTSFFRSTHPIEQALLETHSSKIHESNHLGRADEQKFFALTSLSLSSTSDVITFDQNWHHLCLSVYRRKRSFQ